MSNKVLVLFSGGMDSAVVALHYKNLGYETEFMFFDYGQKNLEREHKSAQELLVKHFRHSNLVRQRITLPWVGDNYYVELRNLIFLSHALSYAESKGIPNVAIGCIWLPEYFSDSSPSFIEKMHDLALEISGIQVKAPLMYLDKKEAYEYGKKLGLSLDKTYSCNFGNEPCGKCPDCLDIAMIIE